MGEKKEKKEKCPMCGNHCPRAELKCGRGRKYFRELEGEDSKKEKSPKDSGKKKHKDKEAHKKDSSKKDSSKKAHKAKKKHK